MRRIQDTLRPGRLLAACALVAVAGCDTSTTSPGGGDSGGEHLVAYSSDRNQTPGQFDIYLYDLDLLGFHSLPSLNSVTAADMNPSLSSNGRLIAFESTRGGANVDILLYDRAAAPPGLVGLPGVNTAADETEPAFSGDLLKLAFVQVTGGFRRIRVMDGVPDTLLALPGLDTTASFNDLSPAPSHTANTIAFVSDRNGNPDVFVWKRGVGLLDLPDLISPERDLDPALSGDGRFLCFASDRSGTEGDLDLYLFDLQDSTLTRLELPSTNLIERAPSLSTDGSVIVFQSDRDGGLGQLDVWNYDRAGARVGQGTEQASSRDDVAPSLRWR